MAENKITWPRTIRNKDLPTFLKELFVSGGNSQRVSRRRVVVISEGYLQVYRKKGTLWKRAEDAGYIQDMLRDWYNKHSHFSTVITAITPPASSISVTIKI